MKYLIEASTEIKNHVELYFKDNLKNYEVINVFRKSSYPDDDYLYMVIGKKKSDLYKMGEYTTWTCWNEKTQSLNHGHYNLRTYDDALNVAKEYYYT